MKVRRGGRTSGPYTTTDKKEPRQYAPSWWPGKSIVFDGTIDTSGERHTELAVVIEEEDVIALHKGLLGHYRSCVKERDELLRTVKELETALTKISSLVSWKNNRAPDHDSLLAAIEEMADHFGHSWNRTKRYKSRFSWLKFKTL